jgi:hypothetical protein
MGISSIVEGNFLNIPTSLAGCPGETCGWQVRRARVTVRACV